MNPIKWIACTGFLERSQAFLVIKAPDGYHALDCRGPQWKDLGAYQTEEKAQTACEIMLVPLSDLPGVCLPHQA